MNIKKRNIVDTIFYIPYFNKNRTTPTTPRTNNKKKQ